MVTSRPKSPGARTRRAVATPPTPASSSHSEYEALVAENLRLQRQLAKLNAERVSSDNRIKVLEEQITELAALLPPGSRESVMSTEELRQIAAQGRLRRRKAPGV
jgi:predicted  nucleic acid-binding Zn-ribbon protein